MPAKERRIKAQVLKLAIDGLVLEFFRVVWVFHELKVILNLSVLYDLLIREKKMVVRELE